MKKGNVILAAAAGVGVAAAAYSLLKKSVPQDAVVKDFDMHRYLGKWYEIARLPNFIERNIRNLTEEYIQNPDGTVKVITAGWNVKKDKDVKATGTIKFAADEEIGRLKVSYLEPVYFDYYVLDVDSSYQYALVSCSGLGYLWILSRQQTIPDAIRQRFIAKAESLGFKSHKLEWV